jgi:hypothetical protein
MMLLRGDVQVVPGSRKRRKEKGVFSGKALPEMQQEVLDAKSFLFC